MEVIRSPRGYIKGKKPGLYLIGPVGRSLHDHHAECRGQCDRFPIVFQTHGRQPPDLSKDGTFIPWDFNWEFGRHGF